MSNDVGIVVVVYNPDLKDFMLNLESYSTQCRIVVVVDNSEIDAKRSGLKDVIASFENVTLIQQEENVGIAKAQNTGIRYLQDRNFVFFLEMDQDSCLPEGYVSKILDSYFSLHRKGVNLCGIGPLAVNKKTHKTYRRGSNLDRFVEVDKTLSSGFLSTLAAFQTIGPKDEGLFIDLVDWDWNFRASSLGFQTYIDTELRMQHMLGDGHKTFLSLALGIPNPIRHYYQFRNTLFLLVRQYVPISWKIINIVKLVFKLVVYPLSHDNGSARFGYMLLGLRDGLMGRSGKIPNSSSP